jgi:chromate transport protein ChrA
MQQRPAALRRPERAPHPPTAAQAFPLLAEARFVSFGGPAPDRDHCITIWSTGIRGSQSVGFLHALNYSMVLPGSAKRNSSRRTSAGLMHQDMGGVVAVRSSFCRRSSC